MAVLTNTPALGLVASHKIDIDGELPFPELMDRYKRDLQNELAAHLPDIVAVKVTFDPTTISAAKGSCMPSGILALVCHTRQLPLVEFTAASFRHPGPFGLPMGSKPVDQIDPRFGAHPPYWDKLQKETVLAAWRALL